MTIAIEKLLTPEINKPARYLGNELGAKHKPWNPSKGTLGVDLPRSL